MKLCLLTILSFSFRFYFSAFDAKKPSMDYKKAELQGYQFPLQSYMSYLKPVLIRHEHMWSLKTQLPGHQESSYYCLYVTVLQTLSQQTVSEFCNNTLTDLLSDCLTL